MGSSTVTGRGLCWGLCVPDPNHSHPDPQTVPIGAADVCEWLLRTAHRADAGIAAASAALLAKPRAHGGAHGGEQAAKLRRTALLCLQDDPHIAIS
mgnify:CR=1 FL=1